MLTTIKGIFRNGRIELDEDPGIIGEAPVVVTFLNSATAGAEMGESKIITFGMLADPTRPMSVEDDFKVAEYDDAEWERD